MAPTNFLEMSATHLRKILGAAMTDMHDTADVESSVNVVPPLPVIDPLPLSPALQVQMDNRRTLWPVKVYRLTTPGPTNPKNPNVNLVHMNRFYNWGEPIYPLLVMEGLQTWASLIHWLYTLTPKKQYIREVFGAITPVQTYAAHSSGDETPGWITQNAKEVVIIRHPVKSISLYDDTTVQQWIFTAQCKPYEILMVMHSTVAKADGTRDNTPPPGGEDYLPLVRK